MRRDGGRVCFDCLCGATSGCLLRGVGVYSKLYSHVFVPRTGRPVVNVGGSATVIHSNGMMADGWAAALTVLGPEAAIALADAQGLAACVLARVHEFTSQAWHAM